MHQLPSSPGSAEGAIGCPALRAWLREAAATAEEQLLANSSHDAEHSTDTDTPG